MIRGKVYSMQNNNNIAVFSNQEFGDIRTVTVEEETYFIGKDVAEALGYKNTSEALNKHVDNEDKVQIPKHDLQNCEDIGTKGAILINESGLYSLIFSSKKPEAKAFKRWVTSEVLPQLRQSGVLILEHADEEAIDFNSVFGRYRIRRSVRESSNRRQLLEQFIELSAKERTANRMNNKDRINSLNIFEDELRNILADNAGDNMRGSEMLAIQELLTDISKEKNRLSNKANGGIKSNQTRRIKELEEENQILRNQLDDDDDENNNWFFIPKHPMSNNFLHEYTPGGRRRTATYRRWINNLHLEECLPDELPGVDITKDMRIDLFYGYLPRFDTLNFEKAIVDQISKYYGFDDKLFKVETQNHYSHVNSYDEGFMWVRITNINTGDDDEEK